MGVKIEELDFGAGAMDWSVCVEAVRTVKLPVCLCPCCFSTSVSLARVAVDVLRRPKSSDGRVRLEGVGLDVPRDPHIRDNRLGRVECLTLTPKL